MDPETFRLNAIRKHVSRAGGTQAVASRLGVSPNQVIEWARQGRVDDPDHALALISAGEQGRHLPGPTPRCAILLPGELNRLIKLLGGLEATANWLGVCRRTLRRYRFGQYNMPEELADSVRAKLDMEESDRSPATLSPEAVD